MESENPNIKPTFTFNMFAGSRCLPVQDRQHEFLEVFGGFEAKWESQGSAISAALPNEFTIDSTKLEIGAIIDTGHTGCQDHCTFVFDRKSLMRTLHPILSAFAPVIVLLIVHSGGLRSQSTPLSSPSATPSPPPVSPVRPATNDYYGTKVVDPYRYMENPQDPEVQAWMKAQNDYTRAVLARIPGRQQLLARIRELDQSAPAQVFDVHRLPGDIYFYLKLVAGEEASKLYMRRGLNGAEKLLVDPERIVISPLNKGKGKNVIADSWGMVRAGLAPSDDGKYIVIGITPGGSENDTELHVIETASGHETGDVILRATSQESGLPNWLPDNQSFVYGRLQKLSPGAPAAEVQQKYRSYLHVIGTSPEKDPPVFGNGVVPWMDVDPQLFAVVKTQPGCRYALGLVGPDVSPNQAFYIEPVDALRKSNPVWRKVADLSDQVADIAIHGDDLYLLTFKNAPRYKIVRTDARKPDLASAVTIVPAGEAVVQAMVAAQDALYVQLLDGGIGRLLRVPYQHKTEVERIALPFEGSVSLRASDPRVTGTMLTMGSWTKTPKIYVYDPQTQQVNDTQLQPPGLHDNPANVEAVEVKVRSYDGTQVPLSIVHRRGLQLDGSNPTHLTGYGSYGSSQDPTFLPFLLAFYERGGVYATCHVRGGGEYGEEWHLGGKGPTKPNTWRDFIACAEYLVDQKYSSPENLAGFGSSAGGILIGRAITERPDLFAAAIDFVGISDTLRFEVTANGETNIPEFGTTKTEEGFRALFAMSAYHHVKDQTAYPAVLLLTGINDPRVDPWESAKMTARLQAATSSGKPILMRVDYGGGHGGGSGEEQAREQTADLISFDLWQLGVPEFQPPKP
jgi:prolyl oligopeptidase